MMQVAESGRHFVILPACESNRQLRTPNAGSLLRSRCSRPSPSLPSLQSCTSQRTRSSWLSRHTNNAWLTPTRKRRPALPHSQYAQCLAYVQFGFN
jgi:hypothetical protein